MTVTCHRLNSPLAKNLQWDVDPEHPDVPRGAIHQCQFQGWHGRWGQEDAPRRKSSETQQNEPEFLLRRKYKAFCLQPQALDY